jgi:hypothetical protein
MPKDGLPECSIIAGIFVKQASVENYNLSALIPVLMP